MEYKFEFNSTHQDLIDSYTAVKNSTSGLSDWSRGAILILGFMWLVGFIFLAPKTDNMYQAIIWLVLGVFIIWKVGFKPYLEKKHIKDTNDENQKVALLINNEGITAFSQDGHSRLVKWENIEIIESAKKGIFIGFDDGLVNWLPNRLFSNKNERNEFIDSINSKINELP